VLNTASLGGADHRTPAVATPPQANVRFGGEGVTTWRDGTGTRWLLTVHGGTIGAYKVSDAAGAAALTPAWRAAGLARARTPIVVNGVVFAVDAGQTSEPASNAVLYALDPATGAALWNSGKAITAPASSGLAAGTGQVYVVTHDNTVWAFGIPLAID
jgi:outer membrane protein assembly factor BamB